jgi:hypothetical protein
MINIEKLNELREVYEENGLGGLIKHLVLQTFVLAIHTSVDVGAFVYNIGKKPINVGRSIANEVSELVSSDDKLADSTFVGIPKNHLVQYLAMKSEPYDDGKLSSSNEKNEENEEIERSQSPKNANP